MKTWITDRVPTNTDSVCGLVMVPSERVEGWIQKTVASIKPGDPWAPWPTMPPFEPEPEYWSKPSDIPANALWFLEHDGECEELLIVTVWGIILANEFRIAWKELSEWRWSDRPFDRFKDGNPCTKGELISVEAVQEYWSRPSDFPPVCWLWRPHWECCALVTSIYPKGLLRGRVVCSGMSPFKVSDLKDARWSDRPFDRFEDGKPCVKGGSK